MLTFQQADARIAKPRIRLNNGVWFCGGMPGETPAEAYSWWRLTLPKWTNVP